MIKKAKASLLWHWKLTPLHWPVGKQTLTLEPVNSNLLLHVISHLSPTLFEHWPLNLPYGGDFNCGHNCVFELWAVQIEHVKKKYEFSEKIKIIYFVTYIE